MARKVAFLGHAASYYFHASEYLSCSINAKYYR
jgi:hypothetical protein